MSTTPVRWSVAAGAVLYVLSRLTGGVWLGLAGCALVALGLSTVVVRHALGGVQVESAAAARVVSGAEVPVSIAVRNAGRWPLPPFRVTDHRAGVSPAVALVPSLRPGEHVTVPVTARALDRGVYTARVLRVEVASVLGTVVRALPAEETPLVVRPARGRPLAAVATGAGQANAMADRAGRGVDVHGLRTWQSGDPGAAVHWRSSARRGSLLVLERAEDVGGGLAVCFGPLVPEPETEALVARLAATVVKTIRDGHRVALFAPGCEPLRDCADLTAALDWVAAVRVDAPPDGSLLTAAARTVHRGGTVLWVATAAPPAGAATVVRRAGAALLVATPERVR